MYSEIKKKQIKRLSTLNPWCCEKRIDFKVIESGVIERLFTKKRMNFRSISNFSLFLLLLLVTFSYISGRMVSLDFIFDHCYDEYYYVIDRSVITMHGTYFRSDRIV